MTEEEIRFAFLARANVRHRENRHDPEFVTCKNCLVDQAIRDLMAPVRVEELENPTVPMPRRSK